MNLITTTLSLFTQVAMLVLVRVLSQQVAHYSCEWVHLADNNGAVY